MTKIKTGKLFRTMEFDRSAIDKDGRTVDLSFSSEDPYKRWWGVEILDHGGKSVRLGRLRKSGPLLMDHDPRDHVGAVESVSLADRKGRSVVRFGKSQRAEEVFQDVIDGIRKSVSVGYLIHKMVLEEENKDKPSVYRATDWEPLEVSLVAVPADINVGVGREEGDRVHEIEVVTPRKEEKMDPKAEVKAMPNPEPKALEVDVRAIQAEARDEARKAELERIRTIRATGEKMGHEDLARKFESDGGSVEQFREALLDAMGDAGPLKPMPENAAQIGLTEKDIRRFSFLKAINALANPAKREFQEAAAFEYECSRAAAAKMKVEPKGILVPFDVLSRDLTVGTPTAGGNLVATDLLAGSFINMLENAMALSNAGITRLTGLVGNIAIPRATGGATAYWVAENTDVTESQQAFDQVALSPETVGAFTDYSRRLLLQSSISVENFVRNDLALRLALGIDLAGLHGSGASNQPTGIENVTGINTVAIGTDGGAPTYTHVVTMETEVSNDNAALGALGYITNTKVRGKLKLTEKFSGTNGNPVWAEGNTPLNGYRSVVSNQVKSDNTKGTGSNLSYIFFGNWADLILGMWGGLDIIVDPYTGSKAGTIRVVVLQDCDIAVRHAESFCMVNDAVTT